MRAPLLVLAVLLAGCADPSEVAPPASVASAGWPPIEAALLRPGDKLLPRDRDLDNRTVGSCTVNFVFASADGRSLYVATASHCISGMRVGDAFRVSGVVDAVLAYCSWGTMDGDAACPDKLPEKGASLERGVPNDFALFRVADADRGKVHPALRHWGGPTALADAAEGRARVLTYGNSAARDGGERSLDAGDAREGYVVGGDDPWWTDVVFAGPSVPGDSGSPVLLSDGRALGVLKSLDYGTNGVVSLHAALAYLHENTDLRVELQTWELLVPPTLPGLPR